MATANRKMVSVNLKCTTGNADIVLSCPLSEYAGFKYINYTYIYMKGCSLLRHKVHDFGLFVQWSIYWYNLTIPAVKKGFLVHGS